MTAPTRVQLIGDSIAIGYAPLVRERLAGAAEVLPPPANAGDSANLLANLDAWVLAAPPDLLHLNGGLHDLKRRRPDGRLQQPIAVYRERLRTILGRLDAAMPGRVIWATITPVIAERHRAKKDFDRYPADVAAYNEAALAVAASLGVAVNDLHAVIEAAGPERCLGEDGVHMSASGNALLAEAVARTLREAIVR